MPQSNLEAGRTRTIVGREAELSLLESYLEADPRWAVILTGGPGIGKTTVWEAGVDLARQRGLRVLSARGNDAETRLSFAALIDLLEDVGPDELEGLPPPQREALEVALYRAEPRDSPPATHAIALGLLHTLRCLADREPLLIAVDDIQWLDRASADALAFAARRLDAGAIAFLLAKRSRTGSPLESAFGQRGPERMEVGPLSLGALQRILSTHLDLVLPRQVLRRVAETTLGNPLFALELGRTLAAHGPVKIGQDMPFPDSVEELLGTRVAGLPDPVRTLLLAVALNGELRTRQVGDVVDPAALDDAIEAGVLSVDGERVRPAHPMLATVAKSRARADEQRELHLALARLAPDDETRALHLALAANRPDEGLATAVAEAAGDAAARGARLDAVVLAEHALRLTPSGHATRAARVLALAEYLRAAGDRQRLTDILLPELDTLPRGAPRAQALRLLSTGIVDDNDEIRRYLDEALSESGDDRVLRSTILVELAQNDVVIRVEGIEAAEEVALGALELARHGGPLFERRVLHLLGWARALRGGAIDDVSSRFLGASEAAHYIAEWPERVAAQRLVWRGEVQRARDVIAHLLALADERGEAYSFILLRLHLCSLELRIGNCDEAERLLDEWGESSDRVMWSMYERCRALLGAGRGLADETERWAAETLAGAEARGNVWDRLEALRARGTAALLTGDSERAAADLREVWEHTRREGVNEPGVFPVAPDLVEALADLGEIEEAGKVVRRLRKLATEQEHAWGLTTAARCDAVVRLAAGYDEAAAATLERGAAEYGALGLPYDRARTLLALGRAQRRFRKWGAARESLERSAAAFSELGAPGWAAQAISERDRVGGRRARQSEDELTPAEQRVVELAVDGLANKEIAAALFVSVRTVEVHLKNAYAKLGIRSRTQLARRLSEPT